MAFTNAQGLEFYNAGQEGIGAKLRRALERAGAFLGRPLGITSGYRSPEYNARIGGANNSWHSRGGAADIDMAGMSTSQRQQLVRNLIDEGAGGLITYSSSPNMLHVDMRPQQGGKAWFMHDRTNRNLHKAPGWFQQLKDYVAGTGTNGVGGNQMAQRDYTNNDAHLEPIPGVSQITVPYSEPDDLGFGQDYTSPDLPLANEQQINDQYGVHDHAQDGAPDGGDVGIGTGPFGIDLGWLNNVALTILFVVIGLVFLAAGLYLITKGEVTLKMEPQT